MLRYAAAAEASASFGTVLSMLARSHRIPPARSVWDLVYRIADGWAIAVSLWLCLPSGASPEASLATGSFMVLLQFLAAEFTGLYAGWRGAPLIRELASLLATWLAAAALLALAYAMGLPSPHAALGMAWWLAVGGMTLAAGRAALRIVQRMLRAHGFNRRRFAIVGVNSLAFDVARNIDRSPELGLSFAGFYDDRPPGRLPPIPGELGALAGAIDDLVAATARGDVQLVYVAFPLRAEARVQNVLARLADSTASVYVVPDLFVYELMHARWTHVGGLPAVSVFETPFYGVDGLLKRLTDLVLASTLLTLLALPMTVIAIAIKLTSRGPVLFRQQRYGLDGRPIWVWKFRSMRVCEPGAAAVQATRGDPRVTPLGAVLRKTSLDELPQLFNVCGGSMSLVGPRPHATAHNEQYRKLIQGYMLRHKVKPGITGLAQVDGWRGETDTLEKMVKRVECDHRYIREWSWWLDVQILFRTIFAVLSRQNAY